MGLFKVIGFRGFLRGFNGDRAMDDRVRDSEILVAGFWDRKGNGDCG